MTQGPGEAWQTAPKESGIYDGDDGDGGEEINVAFNSDLPYSGPESQATTHHDEPDAAVSIAASETTTVCADWLYDRDCEVHEGPTTAGQPVASTSVNRQDAEEASKPSAEGYHKRKRSSSDAAGHNPEGKQVRLAVPGIATKSRGVLERAESV